MTIKNKLIASSIVVGLTLLVPVKPSNAASVILYDGTSNQTPDQQSWLSYTDVNPVPPYNPGSQAANGTGTTLDTTQDDNIHAGYSNYKLNLSSGNPTTYVNPSFPTLDNSLGYDLNFTVGVNSESNNNSNDPTHPRAGFSIIAVSNDQTKAIEIGFSSSGLGIFAQQDGSSPFSSINPSEQNTSFSTSSPINYDLNVNNNTYTLSSAGTSIITGNLKNYSAASGPGTGVYTTRNFIFLGDDTGAAEAKITLNNVNISTNTATVPYEFSPSLGILILAGCGGVTQVLKKKRCG